MKIHTLAAFLGLICLASSLPQYLPDRAEDPNSVDEDIGWSWGTSDSDSSSNPVNRPNQPNLPQRPPPRPNLPAGTGSIVRPTRLPFNQPDTTAFVGLTTVPTEEFSRCFDACPATSQYNPICGSDMQSYHNMAKFQCAVTCGANIRVLFTGTCVPVSG